MLTEVGGQPPAVFCFRNGNYSKNFTLKRKNVSNNIFNKIINFTFVADLFVCNNWVNAEWVFIKFDFGKFCKNVSNQFSFFTLES